MRTHSQLLEGEFAGRPTKAPPGRSALALTAAVLLLAAIGTAPAPAATLSQSVDVAASPATVWAMIGPFCAIETWLPPIGACRLDGKTPPTRTLLTKDGVATFVERETERSEAGRFYSYTFLTSPLPVRNYHSTIRVTANGDGRSTVTWRGEYMPESGKEAEALETLTTVYRAGLDRIASHFGH